jgi:hypothetical protein
MISGEFLTIVYTLIVTLIGKVPGYNIVISGEFLYGRRKGQELAFKTKQTYNVISVNKKPNK